MNLTCRFKMRFPILLALLAAASVTVARPQGGVQKPKTVIPEEISKLLGFRSDNSERANKAANPAIRDSLKIVANQLISTNTTADFTMDTRTPPKIRLQQKNHEKKKQEALEHSHPGVAIPVEMDTEVHESTTQKRVIIHKTENKKPTTDSGISTWILLSEPSTTLKPVKKIATPKPTTEAKTTITTAKPTTKAKQTTVTQKATTSKPTTTSKTTTTTKLTTTYKLTPTTTAPDNKSTTKLMTKIKASVLNNAVHNKNKTNVAPTTKTTTTTRLPTTTTTTATTAKTTTAKPTTARTTTARTTPSRSTSPRTTTTKPITTKTTMTTVKKIETSTELASKPAEIDSSLLIPEAKIGTVNLDDGTTKRPTRPTNKKKKNKNRRRKPLTNSTKIAQKEKPIGTQIYNYISREVMPTVGVGLVGLMVTAGLASYFFSPFGGLRRAYEDATDRKDQHFYNDYSPGGMAEEEMIGKVIAGMPSNLDYTNSYRSPSYRNDFYRNEGNYKYRNSDYNPYSTDYKTANVGTSINYGSDIIEKETGYTVDDNEYNKNQFVVGSYPKDYGQVITPAAVPEHGPRLLRIRRNVRKLRTEDKENEIDNNIYAVYPKTDYASTKQPGMQETTVSTTFPAATSTSTQSPTETTTHKAPNFFQFMRSLFELKVRLGLNFLQRTTQSFSRYLQGVQDRVDNVFSHQNDTVPLH